MSLGIVLNDVCQPDRGSFPQPGSHSPCRDVVVSVHLVMRFSGELTITPFFDQRFFLRDQKGNHFSYKRSDSHISRNI